MPLTAQHIADCETSQWDFSDLKAILLNCTLKPSPALSHTQGLMDLSCEILRRNRVEVEILRPVDYVIPPGVFPDMRDYGWEQDDWPEIHARIQRTDIVVIGTPIWLGDKSSICTRTIERMYGNSAQINPHGQFTYYGRVGGCVITGNEDGAKHCAMNVLYSMQHMGILVPPQADAGWVGEAGPGPSYLDPDSGGPQNDFTNRNVSFMSWNLLHMARMLKDAGGIPAHGNRPQAWRAGIRPDFPNPEHR